MIVVVDDRFTRYCVGKRYQRNTYSIWKSRNWWYNFMILVDRCSKPIKLFGKFEYMYTVYKKKNQERYNFDTKLIVLVFTWVWSIPSQESHNQKTTMKPNLEPFQYRLNSILLYIVLSEDIFMGLIMKLCDALLDYLKYSLHFRWHHH